MVKEIHQVVGRTDPSAATKGLIAFCPECVGFSCTEGDCFAFFSVLFGSTHKLITKSPFFYCQAFVLLPVDMHGRPGTRSNLIGYDKDFFSIPDFDPFESQAFAFTVVDGVR